MSRNRIRFLLAAAAFSAVITIMPAMAGAGNNAPLGPPPGAPPSAEDMLEKFDSDGDGQISAAEFPGPTEHFTHMDSDSDGYLTTEELSAAPMPGPGGKGGFDHDDTDGDGLVSQDEFSGPDDLFNKLDADADGYISKEEAQLNNSDSDSETDTEAE